ncbi:DUF2304 domain-containing protein [Vagococcus xieshaowenii]|uniref:Glycosyl hydrolase family 32 N-terminal domain-containing protein n=1 Tax=Vagococcus xieshaowenii TaxID=2562451 RepID=A0AAJ5EGN9_9ENTE|nr:DUF2304 domain-containing protein [Vagococcus xieshaowenii]QCA29258.1 hypothetical protein E4Z98_07975 [Vagococcus xieshaowenii]TFZ43188.1 hypothetical protein E4031_00750 [Vagococcus xieshaowenii]
MLRLRFMMLLVLGVFLITASAIYLLNGRKLKDNKKYVLFWSFIGIIGLLSVYFPAKEYIGFKYLAKSLDEAGTTVIIDGEKVETIANAQQPLILPTAYQTIEVTHPSVVNFPKDWSGYKYWMAVTPYPEGDAGKENPHIFASHDMIAWDVPFGDEGMNPLDDIKNSPLNESNSPLKYNSDTHLLFNKEKNRLEMFWRYVDDVEKMVYIYQMNSEDGREWSDKELVYTCNRGKGEDWLSPAFTKDENGYQVWYVGYDYLIHHRTSKDGKNWSKADTVDVPYEKENMHSWHLDVQEIDGHQEMLVVGFEKEPGEKVSWSDRHQMNLYYASNQEGKWSQLKPIIYPSQVHAKWDGKGLYRSCMIKEDGNYYVFYSGIGDTDTRAIGLSYGSDIFNLKGISYYDYADFASKKQ